MGRFENIGARLRDIRHRQGWGLEAAAEAAGISRALLYRYESGDVVKLDVLERLAQLYGTATSALLGLGNEYITNGLAFFERVQRLEEEASQLTIVFGPLAYVLTSDAYDSALAAHLAQPGEGHAALSTSEAQRLIRILQRRKQVFATRRPALVNIVPLADVERYLANGLGSRSDMPYAERASRRKLARREIEHLLALIQSPPLGVQIGVTRETLPTTGFELLQLPATRLLVTSPFRTGEPTNVHYGVAMLTEETEALRLHEALLHHLWTSALTGQAAANAVMKLLRAFET